MITLSIVYDHRGRTQKGEEGPVEGRVTVNRKPYYINTGMFNGVHSKIFPILKPEPTAKKIIRAIERNTIFAGIPFGYHFIRFWQAILPLRVFDWLFGTVFGIYHTMDHFTGRK